MKEVASTGAVSNNHAPKCDVLLATRPTGWPKNFGLNQTKLGYKQQTCSVPICSHHWEDSQPQNLGCYSLAI